MQTRPHDDMHVRTPEAPGAVPGLQFTGTVGGDAIATAEDYALYAARAMNAADADDTEFIADGATVTAYVHGMAHYSATFQLDLARPYPYPEDYGEVPA